MTEIAYEATLMVENNDTYVRSVCHYPQCVLAYTETASLRNAHTVTYAQHASVITIGAHAPHRSITNCWNICVRLANYNMK